MTRRRLFNPFPGRVRRAGLRNQCSTHGQVEWARFYQCMCLCCQCDNRLTQDPVEYARRIALLQPLPTGQAGAASGEGKP